MEDMHDWKEDHPDGEFRHIYICEYCEKKFFASSPTECPNGCYSKEPDSDQS